MLPPLTDNELEQVVAILGADGISDEAIKAQVSAIIPIPLLARRAIDWIPESFGVVLVSHMAKVELLHTFSAQDKHGRWVNLPVTAEPIFRQAGVRAVAMYHDGPRDVFRNISQRSSIVATVNDALNAKCSIEGATLSELFMLGIPAETYAAKSTSRWRSWFG